MGGFSVEVTHNSLPTSDVTTDLGAVQALCWSYAHVGGVYLKHTQYDLMTAISHECLASIIHPAVRVRARRIIIKYKVPV